MTRGGMNDKLRKFYGDEIMNTENLSERRKKMLEFLLKKENVGEKACQDAQNILDKIITNNLADGKSPHIVVCVIVYIAMTINEEGHYHTSASTFGKECACSEVSVRTYHNALKKIL